MRALLATIAPTQERLTATVRRWLRTRLPAAHELVYEYADCVVLSFSPSGRGMEGILGIRTSEDEVRVYFNPGKGLADPEKLLQGTAKLTRWITVESAATLKRPAVVALVDQAIARNRIPFVHTGLGPVTIQSLRTKK